MDTTKLGALAAALMERLEQDWPDESHVSEAMIVVTIEQKDYSVFITTSSDSRTWVQEAMLHKAIDNLDVQMEPIDKDEE